MNFMIASPRHAETPGPSRPRAEWDSIRHPLGPKRRSKMPAPHLGPERSPQLPQSHLASPSLPRAKQSFTPLLPVEPMALFFTSQGGFSRRPPLCRSFLN